MLRAGAVAGTAAALGAAGLFGASTASAATTAHTSTTGLPYPPDVTDTSHCTPEAAEIFRGFFTAKSEHAGPAAGRRRGVGRFTTVAARAMIAV